MKRFSFLVFSAVLAYSGVSAQMQINTAKPMLSPLTRHYLSATETAANDAIPMPGYVYKKDAAGLEYLSAIIKVASPAVADSALESIHAAVGTRAGNIWTVRVPLAAVRAFTLLPGIEYIQLDEPVVSPHLELARKDTRVDSVHGGYNLPMAYSGKNVVVGVIDFGFDYNHPAFYDTTGSAYRIKRVWKLNSTGAAPAPYGYGREIIDSNAMRATATDNAEQTHGTSTASIAAGSGFGSRINNNILYRGMAYDADLVLVGVRRDSIGPQWRNGSFTDFIDGIDYIFKYASSVSKPAVVNISWGSQSGPHDGSTLFNQACDNLSGAGKMVVMSAGNEGQTKLHLSKTFTTTDTAVSTFLKFTPTHYKRTWVDIWGGPGKTFCAAATLYNSSMAAGNSTGFTCLDNSIHSQYLISSNGSDTCFVEYINTTADLNGKSHMLINIWNKGTDSLGLVFRGTSGTINMWDEYYYYGYKYGYQSSFDSLGQAWAVSGETSMTASDMGSGEKVLLVGAHITRPNWTSIVGPYYIPGAVTGNIASFSSHGPLVDGRVKPDITAPGQMVLTAVNSKDTSYTGIGTSAPYVVGSYLGTGGKYYFYAAFSGTSASAPVASGIVALMLQANPTLTPEKIKEHIFQSAIQDTHTGALPVNGDNTWGHGKINAYGAIKRVLQQSGVYVFKGKKLDCVLFPNPNRGSFTLDYTGEHAESLNMQVLDAAGHVVSADLWNVHSGQNQRMLNLSALPKGLYLVSLSSPAGSVSMRTIVQ